MKMNGWIGVDLDGTLAQYDEWKGVEHIGDPVPKMLAQVKDWLEQGRIVKIFTARISVKDRSVEDVIEIIHSWCLKHGLPSLEVTNVKDFDMTELYDDRAYNVIKNTGDIVR